MKNSVAILIIIIALASCKREQKTYPPKVGDQLGGGRVAYIFKPGEPGYVEGETHGLIAAFADQARDMEWGCYSTQINGADRKGVGTGDTNTLEIMKTCLSNEIAARICGNLVENGYDDWYLPSKEELNKLYVFQSDIGGFLRVGAYWSSTQYDSLGAWKQQFSTGAADYYGKASKLNVRAVRKF